MFKGGAATIRPLYICVVSKPLQKDYQIGRDSKLTLFHQLLKMVVFPLVF